MGNSEKEMTIMSVLSKTPVLNKKILLHQTGLSEEDLFHSLRSLYIKEFVSVDTHLYQLTEKGLNEYSRSMKPKEEEVSSFQPKKEVLSVKMKNKGQDVMGYILNSKN